MESSTSISPFEWVQSTKIESSRLGFLDLPREIRDEIYSHAFRISGDFFMYSADPSFLRPVIKAKIVWDKGIDGGEKPAPESVGNVISIALLRVCQQIHVESSEVLFGHNTFRLYSSNVDFAPRYYPLVRQITFTTDAMIQKIFDMDLEGVAYWWRRHFWRDIIHTSTRLLVRFPNLERLTFPIKSNRYGQSWTPVFMAAGQRDREYRVNVAALWLKSKSPIEDDRLRRCLHMEIVPSGLSKLMYQGSRFQYEDEWDHTEFSEAFEKMKWL